MKEISKNLDSKKSKLEMETLMQQMAKFLENGMSLSDLQKRFVGRTIDDINNQYNDTFEKTPKEKATELVFQAMDATTSTLRKTLAKSALEIYPHLPDALRILAEESSSEVKMLEYAKKAVIAGEEDLGKKFFKKNKGHFWSMMETRPYMRAKAFLAEVLWDHGSHDEAIQHYKDCLDLNPTDNQGLRDVLFTCLLIKNDFVWMEKLIKQYKNDYGAFQSFNRALFYYKKYGIDSVKTKQQIQEAIEFNPYVPKYLLKKLKMPKNFPYAYTYKSKEEAIIYLDWALKAWIETPGALHWLEGTDK